MATAPAARLSISITRWSSASIISERTLSAVYPHHHVETSGSSRIDSSGSASPATGGRSRSRSPFITGYLPFATRDSFRRRAFAQPDTQSAHRPDSRAQLLEVILGEKALAVLPQVTCRVARSDGLDRETVFQPEHLDRASTLIRNVDRRRHDEHRGPGRLADPGRPVPVGVGRVRTSQQRLG